jgi:hypothetical protein
MRRILWQPSPRPSPVGRGRRCGGLYGSPHPGPLPGGEGVDFKMKLDCSIVSGMSVSLSQGERVGVRANE